MSLRRRYLGILSELVPAGIVGVSMLLGSSGPNPAFGGGIAPAANGADVLDRLSSAVENLAEFGTLVSVISGSRPERSSGTLADTNSNSLGLDAPEPAPALFAPRRRHHNAQFPRCLLYAWAEPLAAVALAAEAGRRWPDSKHCRRHPHPTHFDRRSD